MLLLLLALKLDYLEAVLAATGRSLLLIVSISVLSSMTLTQTERGYPPAIEHIGKPIYIKNEMGKLRFLGL